MFLVFNLEDLCMHYRTCLTKRQLKKRYKNKLRHKQCHHKNVNIYKNIIRKSFVKTNEKGGRLGNSQNTGR